MSLHMTDVPFRYYLISTAIFFIVNISMVTVANASTSTASLWADETMTEWVGLLNEGELEKLIESVEENLLSDEPHLFAADIWTQTHNNMGVLEQAWKKASTTSLAKPLGVIPQAQLYTENYQYYDLRHKIAKEQIYKSNSPFLYAEVVTLLDSYDPEYAVTIGLKGAEQFPDFFWLAWELWETSDYCASCHDRIKQAVSEGGNLYDTPVGKFLAALLPMWGNDGADRKVAVQAFLKVNPNDAYALKFLSSSAFDENGGYDRAIEPRMQASKIYPFRASQYLVAKAHARLGDFQQAEAEVEKLVSLYTKNKDLKDRLTAQYYAKGLRQAGWEAEARRVLEAALKRWPDDADLNIQFVYLEQASGRLGHGIKYARKAVAGNPENQEYQNMLVQTLYSGDRATEAMEYCERLKDQKAGWIADIYVYCGSAFEKLEEYELALQFAETGLQYYPHSRWLQAEKVISLFDLERNEEALPQLHQIIEQNPDYSWAQSKLVDKEEKAIAITVLEKIIARYPENRTAWKYLAKLYSGKELEKMWVKAAKANPGAYWAREHKFDELTKNKKWLAAIKYSKSLLTNKAIMGKEELDEFYTDYIWAYERLFNSGEMTNTQAEQFLKAAQDWEQSLGQRGTISYYKARAYGALGDKEKASEELKTALQFSPGWSTLSAQLVYNSSRLYTDNLRRRAGYYIHRLIERDPYNGDNLYYAASAHTKWIGGSIIALEYIAMIEENAPDKNAKSLKGQALSSLGVSEARMREYMNSSSISGSQRYIDWFDTSRQKAQRGDVQYTMGPKPHTFTLLRKDGTKFVRRENKYSGRVEYLGEGAVWIQASYGEYGDNLTRIEASNGRKIELDYDAKGKIYEFRDGNKRALTFEYNEQGKPIKIVLKGVGYIDVTYDEAGEIKSVNSPEGHRMALQVTQAFQNLLTLTKAFEPGRRGGLESNPLFKVKDAKLEELEDAFDSSHDQKQYQQRGLALASYYVDKLESLPGAHTKANNILDRLLSDFLQKDVPVQRRDPEYLGTLVSLKHLLLLKSRPDGLDQEAYLKWALIYSQFKRVSIGGSSHRKVSATLQQIEKDPLKLLPSAAWLVRSDLVNPGYWRRFKRSEMLPESLRRVKLQSVLIRKNGDVVIGTERGISILHRGFWHWYGVDTDRLRLSDTLPVSKLTAGSNILSLAETDDGALWLGTADGVFRFENIQSRGKRWRTVEDGLSVPGIQQLATNGNQVYVLTKAGLARFGKEGGKALYSSGQPRQVARMVVMPTSYSSANSAILYVTSNTGLYRVTDKGWKKVYDKPTDLISLSSENSNYSQLIFRSGVKLYRLDTEDEEQIVTSLPDQHEIVAQNGVRDMIPLNLSGGESGLAILTDQGMSVFRDEHIEHTRLDFGLTDRTPDIWFGASGQDSLYVATDNEILVYQKNDVYHSLRENRPAYYSRTTVGMNRPVLLKQNNTGFVFFYDSGRLYVAGEDNGRQQLDSFVNIRANDLAQLSDGTLITNDGMTVLKYDVGSIDPVELFTVDPFIPEDGEKLYKPVIQDLHVSKDGAIWVVTNVAVFRWKDNKLDEYNWFKDENSFPYLNDMLFGMVETLDGRLWVVSSQESHLKFRNKPKVGGVAEFDGSKFVKSNVNNSSSWFITSYTKLDQKTAIVGTLRGFVRHRGKQYTSYNELKDASYDAMKEITPMLFFGTKGVRLGEDTLLFGTAGGIVALHNGKWFYPDRLNRLLPQDSAYANKGGRMVHDIEVDDAGRIYAVTDRGLMIFSGSDSSGVRFLHSNAPVGVVVQDFEHSKMAQEASAYIEGLNPDSDQGKAVKTYRKLNEEINILEQATLTGIDENYPEATGLPGAGGELGAGKGKTSGQDSAKQREELRDMLRDRNRAKRKLLANIQSKNPGLYQMLELKPFDIQAMRKHLKDGQLVVQYIPTKDHIVIHLVTKDGFEIREVAAVPRDELYLRTNSVRAILENFSKKARGIKRKEVKTKKSAREELNEHLAWLYDNLLLPVEFEVKQAEQVFFVGTGALNYLPYSALRKKVGSRYKYAIEHFDKTSFGYMPTLYLFGKAVNESVNAATGHSLVVGNPTGDLKGAEKEARSVAGKIKVDPVLIMGEDADRSAVESKIDGARWIHLAAHGVLESANPYTSHLLLANGERLDMYSIMGLPMQDTELVVLSACNSGRGITGQEYTTLSWSFAHAGVPSVVATLWQIPDQATQKLMVDFYDALNSGQDRHQALSTAQKAMLSGKYKNKPEAWAGFVAFGRP